MSVTDILVDFAIASFFIAVGQLLRAKVPLVQKFFIPPSMIAGFIALALGAQGLGILPFSENIGSYASVLIILIFAGVGINGFSGSIIFFVGLTLPRYRFSKPSASLDMNLR